MLKSAVLLCRLNEGFAKNKNLQADLQIALEKAKRFIFYKLL